MGLPKRLFMPMSAATAGLLAVAPIAPSGHAQVPSQVRIQVLEPQAQVPMDPDRARQLYVPTDPQYQSVGRSFLHDVEAKAEIDARYAEVTRDVVDFQKVTYRSPIDELEIPAYLFQPRQKRGPRGHAAMVWVHGGIHGNWDIRMWPFVKEAVDRGYVIIAPEYRGSTGYGEAYHKAIDYGGYDVDDTVGAADHLHTLPHVDPDRIGMMGWSHGGLITLLSVTRSTHPFRAAAAITPVTNLVFRLSYLGPRYQWDFSTQDRIQGLPFEKPDLYVERSPYYHVDDLRIPLLVHVATNDADVSFAECRMLVDALVARKHGLAETKVYQDPPGGHLFSRRVDASTLERQDTPEQIDSWNRTWVFFEWTLRPSEGL
jgi:dipeptidyl aminopeptidase/acylaminoacyl peptidase